MRHFPPDISLNLRDFPIRLVIFILILEILFLNFVLSFLYLVYTIVYSKQFVFKYFLHKFTSSPLLLLYYDVWEMWSKYWDPLVFLFLFLPCPSWFTQPSPGFMALFSATLACQWENGKMAFRNYCIPRYVLFKAAQRGAVDFHIIFHTSVISNQQSLVVNIAFGW